jgi:hypothetical protein
MKRIIKFIIKLILFTILGAAVLYTSPIIIALLMSHILLVWAKNDTPLLTCAKRLLKEYADDFNLYKFIFKSGD